MELGGYPLYVFAPLLIGLAMVLILLKHFTALPKALGLEPGSAESGERMQAALYGSERRLRELGVHRTVWAIRLVFIGETLCILLFTYLIYRVEVA